MRASICVGKYTEVPYVVTELEIPVYSMEELCFCLKENAYLLDVSLMNDGLLKWIDRECGLHDLARELHPLVHRKGALSAFVLRIQEYTGLYPENVLQELEQVLKQGAGLSSLEKRKGQIDYLVGKKKYMAAVKGYDALLAQCDTDSGAPVTAASPLAGLKASLLHNKGVAYTCMMLYGKAADSFWEAYLLEESDAMLMTYLAAKRMELTDGEYVAHTAGLENCYGQTLALEKQLDEFKKEWINSTEYRMLQHDLGEVDSILLRLQTVKTSYINSSLL